MAANTGLLRHVLGRYRLRGDEMPVAGNKYQHKRTKRIAVVDSINMSDSNFFNPGTLSKRPNGYNIIFHYEDDGKPLKLSKSLFTQGHKPL